MSDWRNRIVDSGEIAASELLGNVNQLRIHSDRQRDAMTAILGEIGWVGRVIVSHRSGLVIDGRLRVEEAAKRGETVPYDRVDLTEDEERKILATYDYVTGLAEFDTAAMDALLAEIGEDGALAAILEGIAGDLELPGGQEPPGDPGAALHRAEELRDQYGVRRGQLWQLGRHRLMCGDAYDDCDSLLRGIKPDLANLDPPYGISIVAPQGGGSTAAIGGAKPFGATSGAQRKSGAAERSAEVGRVQHGQPSQHQIIQSNYYPVIEGDDTPFDPLEFLDVAQTIILWGANYYADRLPVSAGWIVWDKRENITRNTFADCELAWSNQDRPARLFHHLWNGLHKGSQHGERRTHPTEKPVALFEEIGRLFCPDGVWLDLFAGTGAQLVAAENTGATCYAMEIEPLYVATILERLSQMGLEPRLAS